MSELRKTYLCDGFGNPIRSLDGAINVHDADVHRQTINKEFHLHTTPSTTLSIGAVAGDVSITVASAVGFVVGDRLHIEGLVEELIHPYITIIVGNVLTLSNPLDYDHPAGAIVQKSVINMNVVGALASPISFKVTPATGEIWHIKQLNIIMAHSSAGDFGIFGNIAAPLVNGVVLRRYDGLTATYSTFTVWRNNGDIDSDFGTVRFFSRSGGGGTFGTAASGNFSNVGSIVYLNGTNGDFIEVLVQDDLSTLVTITMKAQGHSEAV